MKEENEIKWNQLIANEKEENSKKNLKKTQRILEVSAQNSSWKLVKELFRNIIN